MGNQFNINQDHPDNWQYIGTHRGVETYIKKVKGSKLLAFRGVILLDMHISQAMGPYINLTLALDWVSMLKYIKRYPLKDTDTSQRISLFGDEDSEDLVHQKFELPWPVSPREILLHRKFTFSTENRSVAVNYHSVEDRRIPPTPGIIRAESPFSLWKFRALSPKTPTKSAENKVLRWFKQQPIVIKQNLDDREISDIAAGDTSTHDSTRISYGVERKRRSYADGPSGGSFAALTQSPDHRPYTVVEIESFADSKGNIPAWFINYMQKSWPAEALNAYKQLAETGKVAPYARVLNW
eukprot:CAMPEP_0175025060 /NCGR_PEP_ID=MMETSP0005-20121125/16866_1 /TAXON_ID=420556 /ORGANISM="Ochromonas sp., Strain CCMP1393" /LENGTH=295 /DNA_ID=CAMNT_0016283789 /DNA_START=191 /DNA_END=1078 /DNA_ORIENTATION=+